ncbi:MAG: family 10 glycosylhydrolase, partial [Microcystaceae cyanobacterium]
MSLFDSFRPRIRLVFTFKLIVVFLATVLLVVNSSVFFSGQAQSNYPEIRGIWITNNDTSRFMDQGKTQQAVDLLAQLNFNTLYPVVWNSGYVLYESAIAQQEGIKTFNTRGKQGQDSLADLIGRAHQQGLLVLPWFEFGFMVPETSELALKHPQWLTQRQNGSKTT